MVLVEGVYNNEQLPDYSSKIFKHIKLPIKHILWVKENLINIGFKSLPTNWKYGGWVDRDIAFCNLNWAQDSIEKLKECDVIQPWKEFLYLDKKDCAASSIRKILFFFAIFLILTILQEKPA